MAASLTHTLVGNGGTSVVLLHGFLGMGRNLATLARRWSEADPSLRIIVPDLTGHGTSPPLPANADLSTMAWDVLGLLDVLGVEEARWVGHSLGGRVALKAAEIAPSRALDVTVLDIAPGPIPFRDAVADALESAPPSAPDRAAIKAFLVGKGVPDGIAEWLMMNLARDAEGVHWRIDRSALNAFRDRTGTEDLWPTVRTGRIPIRVIRGGGSPFVSDEDAATYARFGARVDTIAGAGHFIHMDAPDELLRLLTH